MGRHNTLIKSVQSNLAQKKSKGKKLANLNNPSKVGNNFETKQKITKAVRNEEKVLKNSSNKVATPEILTSNKESP